MPAKGQRKVTRIEFDPLPRKVVSYEYPASKLERLVAPMLLVGTMIGCWYASTLRTEELINPYIGGEVQVVQAHTSSETPKQTPEPTPTATPEPETEKEQIIAYVVEVFGEDAPDAFNVIYCENRQLDPHATNHNRNGTVDRGIFQLNSAYWGGEELYDWKTNIDKAYEVFVRAGKTWKPWTCSHRVGQTNYLGE